MHGLQLVPCSNRSCSLTFPTQAEMEQHKQVHAPFRCHLCDYATASTRQLREHHRGHRGSRGTQGGGESSKMESRGEGTVPLGGEQAGIAGAESQEEQLEVDGESVEQQHSGKGGGEEEHVEETTAGSDPKDYRFKGHVAEGTEHLYRTHMCPECRRCFKKRTHLLEHLHLHFPDPQLQCPTCQHYFTSKSKLRIHLLREAGQKPHRCHLCQYGAVERNSLRRHLASVHGGEGADSLGPSEEYPCPTCGERFQQSQALKAHMKSHRSVSRQPLRCFQEGCGFQGSDRRMLQRHAREAHGVKAVQCRHHACGAFFANQEAMEMHRRTHLAFHCPNCDFSCSNKSAFQRHKRQGHAGTLELRCAFCPFSTFNPVEFEEHISRLHANEKTHRCAQCNFVTAHKRVLGRHMLLHSGEKPHKCKLCDFRCRDETYLSKHMLTHSDDKNHMCAECGYVTKWKHYLNVHMRKHAGDLRYRCDQCPYRCHRADQLSSHKLRHQEKSLMCEVCAFSCKRKYELRRHMELKHASGDVQAPLFQCKYCPYGTQYRQALRNHENCKHTRHREFRCALCQYITFSSTSFFLHKRKAHGYVPGDRAWLDSYAERERANGGFGSDLLRDLSGEQAAPTATEAEDSRAADFGKAADLTRNERLGEGGGAIPANGATSSGECQVVSLSEASVLQRMDDAGECCTLVLTTVANMESAGAASTPGHSDCEGLADLQRSFQEPRGSPARDVCCRVSGVEEDEAVMVHGVGPSDGEESAGAPEMLTWQACEDDRPGDKAVGAGESSPPESRLMALRRQDKEQVDALVLEGRVQMLVVEAKDRTHRCDRCDFATHRPASLAQHRRSCRARRSALLCKDCGAEYKQQRGLETHRLRKCPVLLKKSRRFPARLTLDPPTQDQGEPGNECMAVPSGSISVGETISMERELNGEGVQSSLAEALGTSWEKKDNSAEGRRRTAGTAAKDPASAVTSPSGTVEMQGYSQVDGRFECRRCPFSSRRLATIERHRISCAKAAPKPEQRKEAIAIGSPEDADTDGEREDEDEDVGEIVEEAQKETKGGHRFSCFSCPFVCHQERALESHRRRGCLKPDEMQCERCSFVAKSHKALSRHALLHSGKKPLRGAAPGGKRERLQCQLCPFTCKQDRCLAQHVALRHEGVRPHRCRFCGFSTTRRYRLEAHESLHTGVGRLPCRLCERTFGTTSKLRLHERRVHERQPTHFCSLCDYGGYGPSDVARHTLSCHVGAPSHTCDLCGVSFSSDAALKQHRRRQHREPDSLSCPHCDFTCSGRATLMTHLRQQHPRLECATCRAEFPSRETLEEHRQTHLAQRCPVCPFAARGKQTLAQHLLDEHEDGPAEDKVLRCAACDFACRHRLVFEQHVRSHGGARLYRCTDCRYSTRSQQKITWHMRIHTGEKPYHCELCSYACADPSRLKYHMRIHQDERKYLCPECGYKCKWVNQLKYHMTKHTGAKPYMCEECDYRTNRADALRVHRETRHRDARPFICEKCGKGFKTRFLLRTHQRRHSEARPYVCRLCRRAFRWPAGLRHHFLTHTQRQPFHCCHCPYRARQRFQVLKHIRRHHPEQPPEQGVGRDPGPHTVSLHEARLELREEMGPETERTQVGEEQEAGPETEQVHPTHFPLPLENVCHTVQL
uniref:Zinc finger protein 142 n=2 Tax=Scleropages formosus TaxID=113540 RepID=A0A8C9TQZ9_SCLFO